jgi:hypothetical protein
MVSKLRGIGVTAIEKLGELLLTVSIGDRVHIASHAAGEDAEEVSRRPRQTGQAVAIYSKWCRMRRTSPGSSVV